MLKRDFSGWEPIYFFIFFIRTFQHETNRLPNAYTQTTRKNCPFLLGTQSKFLFQINDFSSEVDLVSIDISSLSNDPEHLRNIADFTRANVWCTVSLVQVQNYESIPAILDTVYKVIGGIRHKYQIVLRQDSHSNVTAIETYDVKVSTIYAVTDSSDSAWIHLGCPNQTLPVLSRVDFWNSSRSDFVFGNVRDYFDLCYGGRTALFGKTLVVSIMGTQPFVVYQFTDGKVTGISGTDLTLMTILAKKFKFGIKLKPERSWGSITNGSWTGSVGSVRKDVTITNSLNKY